MGRSEIAIRTSIGRAIKRVREAAGISRANLAHMIFMIEKELTEVEDGGDEIPADKLWLLKDILGVSITEFFKGDEPPPPNADNDD